MRFETRDEFEIYYFPRQYRQKLLDRMSSAEIGKFLAGEILEKLRRLIKAGNDK